MGEIAKVCFPLMLISLYPSLIHYVRDIPCIISKRKTIRGRKKKSNTIKAEVDMMDVEEKLQVKESEDDDERENEEDPSSFLFVVGLKEVMKNIKKKNIETIIVCKSTK